MTTFSPFTGSYGFNPFNGYSNNTYPGFWNPWNNFNSVPFNGWNPSFGTSPYGGYPTNWFNQQASNWNNGSTPFGSYPGFNPFFGGQTYPSGYGNVTPWGYNPWNSQNGYFQNTVPGYGYANPSSGVLPGSYPFAAYNGSFPTPGNGYYPGYAGNRNGSTPGVNGAQQPFAGPQSIREAA